MTIDINGYAAKGFEKVYDQFMAHFENGLEIGASLCVQIEGENVINLYAGYKDRNLQNPWQENSLVQFFSTSKPIAAIIIALLQDRGMLSFDDDIGNIWPEFEAHKKNVTIAEALSHQAGVCGFINEIDPLKWLELHEMAGMIANLEPLWIPKSASGYHPLTYGYIANEIVYRILGQDLSDVFKSDISKPLDIDFHFGIEGENLLRHVEFTPPRELPNMGQITPIKRAAFMTKWSAPPRSGTKALSAKIPSTNGFGTCEAVASLYGLFANDGFINGQEIISKSTMQDFTKSRIKGEDLVLGFDVNWAMGIMRNDNKVFGPNNETLGHAGRGGSCGFGDPNKRLSFAYATNKHSNAIIGDKRANALIDALYSSLSMR